MLISDLTSKCLVFQELFPLSKADYVAHSNKQHHGTTSDGSNSFSSETSTENESSISLPHHHSTTNTSPNVRATDIARRESTKLHFSPISLVNFQLCRNHGDDNDSGFSHQNDAPTVVAQPKYSDIVRKVAPASTGIASRCSLFVDLSFVIHECYHLCRLNSEGFLRSVLKGRSGSKSSHDADDTGRFNSHRSVLRHDFEGND